MLIIGNAATNVIYSDDTPLGLDEKVIELVYNGKSQEKLLEDTFNINRLKRLNKVTKVGSNGRHTFIIYDAEKYQGLKHLLQFSLADNNSIKYAPLLAQYAIDSIRIRFIHEDRYFKRWVDSMTTQSAMWDDYVNKLDGSIIDKMNQLSSLLSGWVMANPGTTIEPYRYREFDLYTRSDIARVVSLESKSLYMKLFSSNNKNSFLMKTEWERFSFKEKIYAALERLYVDVINEYVIPSLIIYDSLPVEPVEDLIDKAIMNSLSTNNAYWMNNFIIKNYSRLVFTANYDFIELFKDAIDCGYITPIKDLNEIEI